MNTKIGSVCENGIRVISGCVLLFLMILNFVFSSRVDYGSERVSIEKSGMMAFLSALLFLGAFFLISHMAEKADERILFAVLTVISVAAGTWLIVSADGALRSDPLYVYQTAVEFRGKNYGSLVNDGYLVYYPHQLGLVTYERILQFFWSDVKLLFFCNLLEMTGINFFLWRLTDLLFGRSHKVNVNVIVLSYGFLPQFFFILFAYGLLPGFFCLMGAFYCAAAFLDSGKRKYIAVMAVFSCLAVLLKENFLIGIIALSVWLALEAVRSRRYRLMTAALLLVPVCILSMKAVQGIYGLESGVELGEGVPALLHICMGVNPYNEMWGPGWYDGSNWSIFTQCGQDSQAAAELAKRLLCTYWGQMREDPFHTVKFFVRKIVSIWCEPMYQSVWSGPLEAYDQHMNTGFLQSLYGGEKAEHIVFQYMKGYLMIVLVTNFLFLLKEWKKNKGTTLLLLYNMGGFLFHLFWEAKSQYTYPYLFVLLPICAYMLTQIDVFKAVSVQGKT